MGLGRMMTGGDAGGRQAHDHYATPPKIVFALLNHVTIPNDKVIWDPSSGENLSICKALESAGYKTVATDFYYGTSRRNFIPSNSHVGVDFDWIITNPPFSLLEAFIKRAYALNKPFAFLHKAQYWNVASRLDLFRNCRPTMVLPLTWRPDFLNLGRPTMDVSWSVWLVPHAAIEATSHMPLEKP